ncbi:hypothetical protein [Streptomyces sp. CA-111067]|uniref:hypothetical protein n=1 Tax=Streptomyces sp. CA-111067 TaxID=3240046 RepID=UPI003D992D26
MLNPTLTCFGPAGARVAVTCGQDDAATLVERYLAPWWSPKDLTTGAEPTARVALQTDPQLYQLAVNAFLEAPSPPREGRYAGRRVLHTTGPDGTVRAMAPDDGLAYHVRGTSVTVTGRNTKVVALAACRVAVDLVWGLMEAQGYTLLRASSATSGGKAVLALGPGSGPSTTALLMAADHHYGLQATEAVFARVEADGTISTRPWASSIAVGLGLLDALGWYDIVRDRQARGDILHPGTYRQVRQALAEGRRIPLIGSRGQELTVHLFPDQVWHWFGVVPTHAATAAAVLVTAADTSLALPARSRAPTVNADDVLMPAPEGGDPLGLRPLPPATHRVNADRLVQALAALPHHSVDLTGCIPDATRPLSALADAY